MHATVGHQEANPVGRLGGNIVKCGLVQGVLASGLRSGAASDTTTPEKRQYIRLGNPKAGGQTNRRFARFVSTNDFIFLRARKPVVVINAQALHGVCPEMS